MKKMAEMAQDDVMALASGTEVPADAAEPGDTPEVVDGATAAAAGTLPLPPLPAPDGKGPAEGVTVLPTRLRLPSKQRVSGAPACQPGLRATWVANTPAGLEEARALGIYLYRVGDSYLLHPELYRKIPSPVPDEPAFLGRGDSIIGIIADEDYQRYMADYVAEWRKRLGLGDGTLTREVLG